ncbi:hypothetical protein [Ktedonospora formicarum]|uniref:Uncharacterized protein n=1 Tax=Ktedonospora formicarum TaxID=2778364 RepID=A0A8J3IAW0_9CHLR|nr:hypothetical protein [Ktedonospora formicarum]GHO48679.1 hypothetical protein KSX_68420 [Ktedonospora formicarum]
MYDLYLLLECQTVPDVQDLVQQVPALSDPSLQLKMFQRASRPGFLGLDLSEEMAKTLLQRLTYAGALAQRHPSAYRHPLLTLEQATIIAEQVIGELQKKENFHQSIGPVRLAADQAVCWSFKAFSKQRTIFVNIDKLDGHLWQDEELHHLNDEANSLQFEVLRKRVEMADGVLSHWKQLYSIFDIYLLRNCQVSIPFEDFVKQISAISEHRMNLETLQYPFHVGFFGLDLSYEAAASLLQHLKSLGAEGCRLPAAYRQPHISREQAKPLAEQIISRLHATYIPDDILGPLSFVRESEVCWIFGAASPQLLKERGEPGVLYAQIDKLDGHMWTPEEMQFLHSESNHLSSFHA